MKLVARLLIAVALLTAGSFALAAPGPGNHDRSSHDRGSDRQHDNRRHDNRRNDNRRSDNRRHEGQRYDSRRAYRQHSDGRYAYGHGYRYASPRYYGHPHRWERGHRYQGSTYVVRNYDYYRLRHPPRGYHWVRANNDYLLVAVATGIILDIALR